MAGLGIGILITILAIIFFAVRSRSRLKRLMNSRTNYSREEFISLFAKNEEEKKVVDIIYGEIIEWTLPSDSFPIHPSDNFMKDYKCNDEDLESAIRACARKNELGVDSLFVALKDIELEELTAGVLVERVLMLYR